MGQGQGLGGVGNPEQPLEIPFSAPEMYTAVRPEKADQSNTVDLKHWCMFKHSAGIWFLSEIKGKPFEVTEIGTTLYVYNDHACFH